jgi:probable F420-dependent oxidoreductase
MKIGLYALHRGENVDPDRVRECAQRCERLGFESLWVGDHIALPDDAPDSATEPRTEAVTTLAYLAAVTTTIKLGVGVLVLPQRQPVLLAKQLTTIDVLSRGRLLVGVGVGYVEAELAAFGVTLAERAERTEEYLAAIRAMWTQTRTFRRRHVQWDGVVQSPVPSQPTGPPIIMGGHAQPALKRATRLADGWFGWNLTSNEAGAYIDQLRGHRCDAGRSDPLEITVVPAQLPSWSERDAYAAAGVDRLVLVPDEMTVDATDRLIDHAEVELFGEPT